MAVFALAGARRDSSAQNPGLRMTSRTFGSLACHSRRRSVRLKVKKAVDETGIAAHENGLAL